MTFAEILAKKTVSFGEHLIWTGTMNKGVTPCYVENGKRVMVRRRMLEHHGVKVYASDVVTHSCKHKACVAFGCIKREREDAPADAPAPDYLTKYLETNVAWLAGHIERFPDCGFTLGDIAMAAGVPEEVAEPIVTEAHRRGIVKRAMEAGMVVYCSPDYTPALDEGMAVAA